MDSARGFTLCFACHQNEQASSRTGLGGADLVVTLVYAIKGGQSAHLMHTYKTPAATKTGLDQLRLLLSSALILHGECIESSVGSRASALAVVPSTRAPRRPHPLRYIAPSGYSNVELVPGPGFKQTPRCLVGDLWKVQNPAAVVGKHVLLIDDTWTTGAHIQSAAVALRASGATAVTAVVLARWLDPGWSPTATFLTTLLGKDYDIFHCPVFPETCSAELGNGSGP